MNLFEKYYEIFSSNQSWKFAYCRDHDGKKSLVFHMFNEDAYNEVKSAVLQYGESVEKRRSDEYDIVKYDVIRFQYIIESDEIRVYFAEEDHHNGSDWDSHEVFIKPSENVKSAIAESYNTFLTSTYVDKIKKEIERRIEIKARKMLESELNVNKDPYNPFDLTEL